MKKEKQEEIRSRKWMLTFHNLEENGYTHEAIKEKLESLKPQYWAMVDEIGGETNRLHTHLIIYRKTAIRGRTLTKLFGSTHQDILRGTIGSARSYLLKEGKWEDTEKAGTTVKGTFEEYGELPNEKGQGYRSDISQAMAMVREGATDREIAEAVPSILPRMSAIEHYRQLIIEEKAREFRKMEVIYCYGKTGTGKTSGL